MQNKYNKRITAFSLIEIAIVVLVIGLIVAGIAQASRLVTRSAMTSAKAQTKNSPVALIDDLFFWLETVSDTSFLPTEAVDNTAVSVWNSIVPSSIDKGISASQSTTANQPRYIAKSINNLPALRFDGVDDYMSYPSGKSLVGGGYTVFAVEMRRAAGSRYFFGSDIITGGESFHMGYGGDTFIRAGNYGGSPTRFVDYTVPAFSNPIPRIHTVSFDQSSGLKYWMNGGTTPDITSSNTTPLGSYTAPVIGRIESNTGFSYSGDMAEIIMYSRTLKDDERQEVEQYLTKKWKIKLQ